MKILHTADWHLDVSPTSAPRHEEHERLLDWLAETLERERVEVLLHAGDVFDRVNPSNRALRMFNRFMARISELEALRQVVIISGNHDPDSFLEAQGHLLAEMAGLRVDVICGSQLASDQERWSQECLVPLHDEDEEIAAVVAALPYVHRGKLGVRGADTRALNFELREAVSTRYRQMADDAREAHGAQIPLLAMGHLTCHEGDGTPGQPRQIYLGETLGPDVFDARYDYVALGHIHTPKLQDGGRVCYAGSPVPTCREEAMSPRKLALIELEGGQVSTPSTWIEVPCWRRSLHPEPAPLAALIEHVAEHDAQGDALKPYLYLDIEPEPSGPAITRGRVIAALEAAEVRGRLIKHTIARDPGAASRSSYAERSLEDMGAEELFLELYRSKNDGEEPEEDLQQAFQGLMGRFAERQQT